MRTKLALLLALGFAVAAASPPVSAKTARLERSIVRIVNYTQRPDWSIPWQAGSVRASSGSGVVIAGGLILTNAHVVSDTRLLLVYLFDDPNPHEAHVESVAHDCDLALIRTNDPGALAGAPPLPFGDPPLLGSSVDTLGYPAGGERLSLTRGVVSRIESGVYIHSGADRHVIGQTDAAINPGNSGGPVVQNGKIVGIAFQAVSGLENVGYFIPPEVVRRFLKDVADGRYDGYPELGVRTSNLENPAARRYAGMNDGETGVRVDAIYPDSSAEGKLFPGDVLLAISEYTIANDGSVDLGTFRTPSGLVVDRLQVGEMIHLRVLRKGERINVVIQLGEYKAGRALAHSYDRLPRYYVYAGLVFMPLDLELIKTAGDDWISNADRALLYEFLLRPTEEPEVLRGERVVLVRRLDHVVNADMAWHRNEVVERVNGKKISRLEDLIEALEANHDPFHVLEFKNFGRFGVLDRIEAQRANREILEQYGVLKDRHL